MLTWAVVDAAGVRGWIDVHPNCTARTEPRHILAALDKVATR